MSGIFELNWRDLIKGLILSVLTAVLTYIYQILQSGNLTIGWNQVALVSITALLGYLIKNLATDTNGKLLGKI